MNKRGAMSRGAWLTAVVAASQLLAGAAGAAELGHIRGAIRAKGARWQAEETSVSRLSPPERKQRVGTIKRPVSARPEQSGGGSLLSAPSGSYDWRSIGGNNYVTPVRDQGACGSCWAFATTAALESDHLIHGAPSAAPDDAEQILISCSGAGTCTAGYIDLASDFIRDKGLPPESSYPYLTADGSCTQASAGWRKDTDRISLWNWVATADPTVATLKDALFTYGPLVTTMDVYSDFYSYRSGVYSQVGGSLEGGHAVLIVGYTDDATIPGGGYFTVKNSWGTGWGEGGYFRIAYGELNSAVHFGYYTIAYDGTTASAPGCSYAISPTAKSFTSRGGSGSISVSAGSGCAWSATSGADWLAISSGNTGSGSGTISYSVAPSGTGTSRSATIGVNGGEYALTFTATQQGTRKK